MKKDLAKFLGKAQKLAGFGFSTLSGGITGFRVTKTLVAQGNI
jgi:hypothetical protein